MIRCRYQNQKASIIPLGKSTGGAKVLRLKWDWDHPLLALGGNDQMFLSSVFTRLAVVLQRGLTGGLRPVTHSPGGWNQFARPF